MDTRKEANHPTKAVVSSATTVSMNGVTFFGLTNPNGPLIPQDIFNHLAHFAFPESPDGDAELVKQASANPDIAARYQRLLIKKLLTHVVRGEKAEAEAMIQKIPGLLLLTDTVSDYSGRTIEGTALGMALGAEDVKCHDEDDEGMVEMLHRYLQQLPNGKAIIAEQILKQFPEGWAKQEVGRIIRDYITLKQVFEAIANLTGSDDKQRQDIEPTIQKFKKYLADENSPEKIIKTGKHFNRELLASALDMFIQHYVTFGKYESRKNKIAWRQVIGSINRYVPASTAHALCTSIGKLADGMIKLNRSLKLHKDQSKRDISYFPLDNDPSYILGEHFAVYSCHNPGRACTGVQADSMTARQLGSFLRELYCAKDRSFERVLQPRQDNSNADSKTLSLRSGV